jgi:O-antigen ligase
VPLLSSIIRFVFPKFNNSAIQQFNIFLICSILGFSPLIEGGTTYYPVAIIQILTLILLISGIISFYHGGQYLSLKEPLCYSILIFLGYTIIIAFLTPYKLPAFQRIQSYFFYFILFYFSILYVLRDNQYKKKIINFLCFVGLFETIVGIVQYSVFHLRATGTFFNPDFLGEYLAIIFCVVLGRSFDGFKNKVFQWLYGGGLLFLATGIVLSQSRGAALAWSVGMSVILWRRYRYKIVFAWLLLLLLFTVIPNPLQYRFLNDYREDSYSLSRLDMWKEAIHIIKDYPAGIGLEMYPLISSQYVFPIKTGIKHYSKIAESPHNEYLRLFSELGIAGGIFFVGVISLFYLKWTDKKNQSFTYAGIMGGTIIFLVHALTDSNFHEPALVITAIILSTLLLDKGLFNLPTNASFHSPHPSRFTFFSLLIPFSILLGILIIRPAIGWFYYDKGYKQLKENHYLKGIENFQTALFWEGENARYHSALANSYFNLFSEKNNDEWVIKSLDELGSALELNPEDGKFYKIKGDIYKNLSMRVQKKENLKKLYDEAFTNYKIALKLLPYDASIYLETGGFYSFFERFSEAESAYNQAITLEPNYFLAREKKIELLLKNEKREEALKEYQSLLSAYDQIRSRAVTDWDKSFIYFNQDELKKAFEVLK